MVKFYLNIIEKLVLNTIGKLSSFSLTLPLNADMDTISIKRGHGYNKYKLFGNIIVVMFYL